MKEYTAYYGNTFTIEWYYSDDEKSQALEYFNGLSINTQDSLLMLFKRMGDCGKIFDKTKFNNEGDGIFAFKPKPERFLCFFVSGKKIIITNAFRKKTQKISKGEKDRAIKLKKDYNKRFRSGVYYEKNK